MVIAVEDIGNADLQIILMVYELYMKHEQTDKDKKKLKYMIQACILVGRAKKSRIADWGSHYYGSYDDEDMKPLEKLEKKMLKYIKNKNLDKLHYMVKILCNHEEKLTTGRLKNAQYLIWKCYDTVLENNEYYMKLREIALSKNWRWQHKTEMILCNAKYCLVP